MQRSQFKFCMSIILVEKINSEPCCMHSSSVVMLKYLFFSVCAYANITVSIFPKLDINVRSHSGQVCKPAQKRLFFTPLEKQVGRCVRIIST